VAFSNGIVVSVSGDSEFGITSFKQEPFDEPVNLATMVAEPSVSRLSLRLGRGEVIVRVKHLNHDKGSNFTLSCPGGAATVRGTTFRMSARPASSKTVDVAVEVMEGNVTFVPNGQPNVTVVPGRKYLATLPVSP
jgi:ferric-dicitrate binding protein FerR (iron transport regulator)